MARIDGVVYYLSNIYKDRREPRCCYNCGHWDHGCDKGVSPTVPANTSCRHWFPSKDKRKCNTTKEQI